MKRKKSAKKPKKKIIQKRKVHSSKAKLKTKKYKKNNVKKLKTKKTKKNKIKKRIKSKKKILLKPKQAVQEKEITIKENNLQPKKEVKEIGFLLGQKKSVDKNIRLRTGIPNFDKMIEGGFGNQTINLVVGGSGSGKTIFALQFLIEGAKKGENVLYVSFEEKKDEFYHNIKKMGWDLEKLEKSGRFIFLEYSPEKVKMMLDEGGGEVESLVLRHKIKRMVIDSITSFSVLFEDMLSKRKATLGLFDIINKWDCTTLLTVQSDPSKIKGRGDLSLIEFEADGIILLYFTKVKTKRKRFIEILKMRGTNHSKETHSFEIKKGIVVGKVASMNK